MKAKMLILACGLMAAGLQSDAASVTLPLGGPSFQCVGQQGGCTDNLLWNGGNGKWYEVFTDVGLSSVNQLSFHLTLLNTLSPGQFEQVFIILNAVDTNPQLSGVYVGSFGFTGVATPTQVVRDFTWSNFSTRENVPVEGPVPGLPPGTTYSILMWNPGQIGATPANGGLALITSNNQSTVTLSNVPEPSTASLLACAAICMFVFRRGRSPLRN